MIKDYNFWITTFYSAPGEYGIEHVYQIKQEEKYKITSTIRNDSTMREKKKLMKEYDYWIGTLHIVFDENGLKTKKKSRRKI